jgi:hypothetical protein
MEYISTATAGFGYLAERVPGKVSAKQFGHLF